MLFCPKCGSMMLPQKRDGKTVQICKCGYVSTQQVSNIKVEIKSKPNSNIDIVDKEVETLPITDAECPKCKHAKAYYWTQQTRAADEGETKFMKCVNCKYTWRDYG